MHPVALCKRSFKVINMNKFANHQELFNAEHMLQKYGYETSIHADSNTLEPKFVVVMDPVHHSVGAKLVLMGYEPLNIRSYDAACEFINVRS